MDTRVRLSQAADGRRIGGDARRLSRPGASGRWRNKLIAGLAFALVAQLARLVERDIPSITAGLRLPSGDHVQFYGVHPRPPRPGDDTGDRDRELTLIAREIRGQRRPAILAGDLNDVAWSGTSRRLQETAALRDPRSAAASFVPSMPIYGLGFRWPLDHVFVSDDFALCALERPGDIGSDHFPLLVDVLFQREGVHP